METEAGVPSDEELMAQLQAGNEAALAPLMQRWEVPLKRFIFRLVGNTAEAEDLAQEVFVRIYTKRSSYRLGAKFSTWCFSIAANLAKNRLRWWKRRPVLSLDAWMDSGGDAADQSATGAQASDKVMKRERIATVQAAVAALPLDLRTALVLFEYEQQSMGEIAAALGCTAKAVENRLYRARQKLQQQLSSVQT
ncbi:ECF RNA polymerase sigma factor SigW [Lacunisphaera limnophila]|uniref:ECF RNA polymerase sigma factor SigW n=1 Tax=Lacunisphaera limnophila TaxID=1838286 RepID=A0A1D8AT38_9BACT|nr:sigma-70 family RNA polymerase sigma factor [Lacunisphaera limnophila]AOS44065.1 ECF RNA polymerase sigma factor SigW [Lacunisphaera limnophila]